MGRLKLLLAYEQPDKMTRSKRKTGRQALRQEREPPGGKLGSVGPVGMASVEPLSLKGATGDRGGGLVGRDLTVLLEQYQRGGGAGEGTGRSGTHGRWRGEEEGPRCPLPT